MSDGATNTPVDPATTKPSEPYFIVPPGFRPNSFFVGMDKEYQELDRRLFDRRRRDGTACVLLHGQPGGGKSHLARQYVNKNKGKFNGGIFWINCGSKEERYHAFWNIKQKVVARDSPDLCDGVNGNDFVQMVKTWFELRHEWLVVFDGISIESDEETLELTNFIPDSKNSSIIYVSRQKNLESKQRLLRPHPIKVGPLKEADAVKLLFKELHLKKPTEAEKKKASELAKKTGGLPLAIDAISHRLTDTHEPLTKYKLSTSADPTLDTTYNQIFDDLLRLGHSEAWNLINILCWFAGNIPVEMVNLGLKILRAEKIDVKTREDGGEPDINTTFGILMRYALIERNEPDSDKDSMSSSRDSLSEPEPIDMLKLHGVVQSFCCDSLNARRMLPQWLGYAVKLFSYSYHQADIKIKQRPDPGRVSDYRYYLVHGQRLWEHAVNYETRTQSLEDVRLVLLPVMNLIHEEIQRREPSSSQENLKNGVFQVSIFDRTSSSSDSNELPGPLTPSHRPTPAHLASETMFGLPIDKQPTDSPRSFGTASPGLRPDVLDHSHIYRPLEDHDAGYESDRENRLRSHPMQQTPSEVTERPPNRSRASTAESQAGAWQVVLPTRKPRKPRPGRRRRDLGTFRPTVSQAQLNKENAGKQTGQDSKLHRRQSSPAFKALEKVHSKTSPPPLQSRIAGFIQRTLSGQSPKSSAPQQPTWAGVAAGKVSLPTRPLPSREESADADPVISPAAAEQYRQRGQSDASVRRASPLATEFLPYSGQDTSSMVDGRVRPQYIYYPNDPQAAYAPGGFQYTTPYPSASQGLAGYSEARPIPGQYSSYYAPPPLGPNTSALPVVESTTITTRRPVSAGYIPVQPQQQHRLPPPTPPFPSNMGSLPTSRTPSPPPSSRASPPYTAIYPSSPSPPYPLPQPIPAGYSSQPMSRDQSHQSAHSAANTEPMSYNPSFSPYIGPTVAVHPITDPIRPLPVFAPQQGQFPYPFPSHSNSPPNGSSSTREGRPLRRSPQTATYHQQSHPPSPSPLQETTTTTAASTPMSRASSSGVGPGIQLPDGSTVAFDADPTFPIPSSSSTPNTAAGSGSVSGSGSGSGRGRLQFGGHDAISVEEADARLREQLRARRKRGSRSEVPYPDVNLIPTMTGSEHGEGEGGVLQGMVGNGELEGASGGGSGVARGVGLGVDLGGG